MHPAHTQCAHTNTATSLGGDVAESQGWLIDLGMVLIVPMMEGGSCRGVYAQGFQGLRADSSQSHFMKRAVGDGSACLNQEEGVKC